MKVQKMERRQWGAGVGWGSQLAGASALLHQLHAATEAARQCAGSPGGKQAGPPRPGLLLLLTAQLVTHGL